MNPFGSLLSRILRHRISILSLLRSGRHRAAERLDVEVTALIKQRLIIHSTCLGKGGDAEVREATLLCEGGSRRGVAAKIFDISRSERPHVQTEIQNYARLPPHKNILEAYGSGTIIQPGHEEKCFIIVKRMKTSLKDIVCDDDFKASCTFGDWVELFLEIACGLQHMHAQGMVHGDVKPANILLDEDNNAVLADFSRSTWKRGFKSSISHIDGGTWRYMAPEVIDKITKPDNVETLGRKSHISISEYSDIYSLGITMLDTLEQLRKLPISEQLRICNKSVDSSVSSSYKWIPRKIRKLIEECIHDCREKSRSGGNRYGRPSCNGVIKKLHSMRSASWYNVKVQEYVQQQKGDHKLRKAINQAAECCHNFVTRPLYRAARNCVARTASFLNARLRRQQRETADKDAERILNEGITSLWFFQNPRSE